MNLKEAVDTRFRDLLTNGDKLVRALPVHRTGIGLGYYVEERDVPQYQAWLSAAVSLAQLVARPNSHYAEEAERLLKHEDMQRGVVSHVVQKMYGLLTSAYADWQAGLMRQIEYVVAAATFDDFLDHASQYHKANKKVEAAVLASAVLEDTLKKIAKKQEVLFEKMSSDQLIDELTKREVFTPVKAKRVKSFFGIRNHALHANWDEFDIKDVGMLITGIRELIDDYL